MVNMYKELYMRNQFFFLDPKWTVQLRYYLGIRFDELFGPGGLGRINRGEVGQVNARNFEQVLKERMASLASFVASSTKSERIQLRYEQFVERLELMPNAAAVVVPSPKNGANSKFDREMAERNLFSYGNGSGRARMEYERNNGRGKNGGMEEVLPFDMLLCAGGANDRIRDAYLGLRLDKNLNFLFFCKIQYFLKFQSIPK